MKAHNIQVQIWDFNEELQSLPLVTLATWASAMKLELKTGMKHSSGSVIAKARKFLSAPKSYPKELLVDHIVTSHQSAKEQLGL